ncbi:hypothetical protein D9M71_213740 [compost metagenome]
MPGIAGLGRFGAHARAIDGAMGLHAPATGGGIEQVLAQVAKVATASVQFANQSFDMLRRQPGQGAAVSVLDPRGQPVIDIEPGDVEQRQFVQAVADRYHFEGIAHL